MPVLAALFLLASMAGCCGVKAPLLAEEIIAKTASAMAEVKSYTLDASLTEDYTVTYTEKLDLFASSAQWVGQRQVDISRQEMLLDMEIRDDVYSTRGPMSYREYVSGDYKYINQIAGPKETWYKMPLSGADNVTWPDLAQLTPQIDLLNGSRPYAWFKTTSVQSVPCYYIDLEIPAPTAVDWIIAQDQPTEPSLGWFKIPAEDSRGLYLESFKSGSVRVYVSQDDFRIVKMDIRILFDAVPPMFSYGNLGLPMAANETNKDTGIAHILRTFNGVWEFSNYNQPVDIHVPPEALKAVESP
jgi:hypothetical protein